jgi:hypothetical protein
MRLCNPLVLAIVGCVTVAPLAFAQTTPADTKSGGQTTQSPTQADGKSSSATSLNGARKQHTQGLPSAEVPQTDSSWNSQNKASKSQ